jgi:hypothetical protein
VQVLAKRWNVGTIRLRWARCPSGYVIRQRPYGPDDEDEDWSEGPFIYPADDTREDYEATLGETKIFADLLRLHDGNEAALAFTKKWGMLSSKPTSIEKLFGTRDAIRHLYSPIDEKIHSLKPETFRLLLLSKILSAVEGNFVTAKLEFGIFSNRNAPQLIWFIDQLRQFLFLEIVEDCSGLASQISICRVCGAYITRSSVEGPIPDHCSNACKQKLYRQRKAKSDPSPRSHLHGTRR